MKDKAIFILSGYDFEKDISFTVESFSYKISRITMDIEKEVGSINNDRKNISLNRGRIKPGGIFLKWLKTLRIFYPLQ